MGSYSVNFKPSVQKDLRPLPKALVARVMERIEGLKTDPFPRQAIKLSGKEIAACILESIYRRELRALKPYSKGAYRYRHSS